MFFFSFFINGIGGGILSTAAGRMIEEYVPLAMFSLAYPATALGYSSGYFIACLSALLLPPSNAIAPQTELELQLEYWETNVWRYMFGASFVFVIIATLGLLLLVRTDAPKFYTAKGDEDGALKAINTIYNTEGSQI